MLASFLQTIFFLAIVLVHFSFANSVFSGPFTNALVSVTIALSFSRGFDRAWPWVLVLGFLADILALGMAGATALLLTLESFLVSGFFRRFVFDHREAGFAFVVLFSCLASFLFVPMESLLRWIFAGSEPFAGEAILKLMKEMSVGNVLAGVAMAAFSYAIVLRLNRIVDFYEDRVTVVR